MSYQLPASFIETAQTAPDLDIFSKPVQHATENLPRFFSQPAIRAVYSEVVQPPQVDELMQTIGELLPESHQLYLTKQNEAMQAICDLLPKVHPYNAAQLAFLCGSLIESGANPAIAYPVFTRLIQFLVEQLVPFCADESALEEAGNDQALTELAERAQQKILLLSPESRLELTCFQHALDILVPPMMAVLMRDEALLADFSSHTILLSALDALAYNNTLTFSNVYFLHQATNLTYGEFVVVLPTSQTGFVASAHGINNVFHALTFLQDVMARNAQALGIGKVDPTLKEVRQLMHTRYDWRNALAYENGQLTNPMQLAWGEVPLKDLPQKKGMVTLFATETTPLALQRNWDADFCSVIHDAQGPSIELIRVLTPQEITDYLL